MPKHYPFCGEPIESTCVAPEDDHPYGEWCYTDRDETWRHPKETILDRSLNLSKHDDQLDRRDVDADLD